MAEVHCPDASVVRTSDAVAHPAVRLLRLPIAARHDARRDDDRPLEPAVDLDPIEAVEATQGRALRRLLGP